MHSKKKLFQHLQQLAEEQRSTVPQFFEHFDGVASKGLKHPKISNETYGPKSMIYITTYGPKCRTWLERKLEAMGHKVQREYWPGSAVLEVQVSYFKGCHWDE